MIKKIINGVILSLFAFSVLNCGNKQNQKTSQNDSIVKYDSVMKEKLNQFAIFKLTTDFSKLTRKEKQMLPILIDVAKIMDEIFWEETLGDKEEFLKTIKDDYARKFALINYGPWERLNGDKPFIPSYGEKPAGANFYPKDMKKEEFQKLDSIERKNPYSVIRRKKDGTLESLAYHIVFHDKIKRAAYLLKKAAEFAEDKGLKNYLNMRADALMDDKYQKSDFAWMDMKDNTIDFVVGPIENYEDKLFGVKTAHEAFVLVKDKEWTKKLTKFISILPELQKGLPVDQKYKNEVPASGSDLGVYDVLYYAGDCNAASKTIAINLPNDEEVQLKKGARRIQLKNSMQAKFDKIMMPIAKQLIAKDQLKYVKFDAFFNNTMFHEVAHGLGIKNTLNKKGTVREALKNEYSAIEEGKADILGLYMVSKLREMGQIKEGELMDNYVTFIAGIFRSVRFGAASAHGKANMIRFNYFEQKGAFTRDPKDGTYKINFDKMKVAINELSKLIIELEGNGDYAGSAKLTKDSGVIKPQLQKDLDKLKNANIPIDIIFEQGQLNF